MKYKTREELRKAAAEYANKKVSGYSQICDPYNREWDKAYIEFLTELYFKENERTSN